MYVVKFLAGYYYSDTSHQYFDAQARVRRNVSFDIDHAKVFKTQHAAQKLCGNLARMNPMPACYAGAYPVKVRLIEDES